ncbi:ribonuclease toxin immunity protein CdiI [Bacillus glycinifermentans]|uniref:ribonuclease toxin immunity protein CdiI n=1 Tax=Bacillus glycinifermentans TaxID=1664069 RepID=UPI002DC04FF2|nr:ribonuclease toxin immunity protein CdiI [Bacillus glycinifermentans]MEC3605680.1 ribonuclease toxin immunity protein CdiI [Bacillus glycinifermentans]
MNRISKSQQLKEEHFPVKAFFNAISDSYFIEVIESMSQGIGYGINDADCTFPGDLDPGEEIFEGVEFSLLDEEVIVDYSTFFYYLKIACDSYISDFPQYKGKIESFLKVIAQKYNVEEV